MPVIVRSGRGWLVPILVVLVGSLLFDPGLPAAGVDGEVDHPAAYSACVGSAAESAGFTDMGDHFAEDAANCLAHYGITEGTSPGVFSPGRSTSRVQMALFLARAAAPAGITLPSGGNQGFGDISGRAPAFQTAINQMAELGIMRGWKGSATTFAPDEAVTREDMAIHLAAFLAVAAVGPGGSDIDKITPDDTVFTDLRRASHRANTAIPKLYEMGVTKGKTSTTFAPSDPVTRGQMAAFITRTLAHTNARPTGVTVQASGGGVGFQDDLKTFAVSVRDGQQRPIRGVRVDMFYAWGASGAGVTGAGRCSSSVARLGGEAACVIDTLDRMANSYGNLSGEPSLRLDDDVTVWAWTGAIDTRFDEDTANWGNVDVVAAENPVYIQVDADIPGHEDRPQRDGGVHVPYGTTLTFALQTLDSNRRPVAREGMDILVNSSITTATNTVVSAWRGTRDTDESGRLLLTYKQDDPDRSRNDPPLTLVWKVQRGGGFGGLGGGRFVLDPDGNWLHRSNEEATFTVLWDDDASRPMFLSVAPRRPYVMASAGGSAGAAVATLLDQYGDPVVNAAIEFTSNDSDGIGSTVRTVRTGSTGVATYSYRRASATPFAEKVTVVWRSGSRTLTADGCHFWAAHPETSSGTDGTLLLVDTRQNLVLVNQSGPRLFTYSDRARFTVDTGAALLEAFERAIDAGDSLTWDYSGSIDQYDLTNQTDPPDLC